MSTRAEIEDLKDQWSSDSCWDIEDTEGFEAHREELIAYRKLKEAEWEAASIRRLKEKAAKIGCPDNLTLASYVEDLEMHIERLEDSLEKRLKRLENA
jgi:hypothetical protein